MLNKDIHGVLNYLGKVTDVSDVNKIVDLIITYKNTPSFRIEPVRRFNYGLISNTLKGNITIHPFDSTDECYTFGLNVNIPNVITDRSLAVVGVLKTGFTIMDREDCKVLFDYTKNEKLSDDVEDFIMEEIKHTAN